MYRTPETNLFSSAGEQMIHVIKHEYSKEYAQIKIMSAEIIKVLNYMLILGLYKTALLGKSENILCLHNQGCNIKKS